jgi:hypothetical protein
LENANCSYDCNAVYKSTLYVVQCELYHWIDVLNRFDEILEAAAVQQGDSAMQNETTPPQTECIFLCPQLDNPEVKLGYRQCSFNPTLCS